jgi:hypothetical protein
MTGFLIPQTLLFGQAVDACACHTWVQLACLADEAGCTPPLELDELVRWTGKSRATLYRHLGLLKQAGVLDWTRQERVIQVRLGGQAAQAGGSISSESQECECQVGECQVSECQVGECQVGECQVGKCQVGECQVGECQVGECQVGECKDCESQDCESQDCESQNCESQNCECASLKHLINPLINLTREEARFSNSRIISKTRKKPLFARKCANQAQTRGPPGVNCRCSGSQAAMTAAASARAQSWSGPPVILGRATGWQPGLLTDKSDKWHLTFVGELYIICIIDAKLKVGAG